MPLNFAGGISAHDFVRRVVQGDVTVSGKITDNSTAYLTALSGSIAVAGSIEDRSRAYLTAKNGSISVDGNITGNMASLTTDGGSITIAEGIDGTSATLTSMGGPISVGGDITNSTVVLTTDAAVTIDGSIDSNSKVIIVSTHGSITITGKIDGNSTVTLTSAANVGIGTGGTDDGHKIDGNSHVDVTAGASISLSNKVGKDHTTVDFKAGGDITIGDRVDAGATARLLSVSGTIRIANGVHDGSTTVIWFSPNALDVGTGVADGANCDPSTPMQWAAADAIIPPTTSVEGYWWQNWPQTFGYVSPPRVFPRSVAEIAHAVAAASPTRAGPAKSVKAVGGGWSFTDAALPFKAQTQVDHASMLLRGASATQNLTKALPNLGTDATASPMDLLPEAVASSLTFSSAYDQGSLTELTTSGAVLPGFKGVQLIDTRSLASSLQVHFDDILSDEAKAQRARDPSTFLFHVEAGITIADLDQLLDHQKPRMAIQASGGSPGATLAGTISTATHGGEFNVPLLVDRVRAIHLIGPGGVEWWIEGDKPVANLAKLHHRYPAIDSAHFIAPGGTTVPGLTPQQVLKAVTVSMGTMGVIYSVVLEVNEQFGLRQIATRTTWTDLLAAASVTEDQLRQGNQQANQNLLNVLEDGTVTGVAQNVYVDLAINPFNRDCWVTNRHITKALPVDSHSPAASINDYLDALAPALAAHAADDVHGDKFAGRVLDFFNWATGDTDLPGDAMMAAALLGFLTGFPDPQSALLGIVNVQAVVNQEAVVSGSSDTKDRGFPFLGDLLSGFLDALQGTAATGRSDRTDIAYKVGAIGWPDGGIPGRGLEIGVHPSHAFTFLQTQLLDDLLAPAMTKPLVGYISVRVCPKTETVMGMQQFDPSVMIEIVGYRSPDANEIMDAIQQRVLDLNRTRRLRAVLHWGLENDKMTAADLAHTPWNDPFGSFPSHIEAFKAVRTFFTAGNAPVFDNVFTARLGL